MTPEIAKQITQEVLKEIESEQKIIFVRSERSAVSLDKKQNITPPPPTIKASL